MALPVSQAAGSAAPAREPSALILYSSLGQLDSLAQAVGEGLELAGILPVLLRADQAPAGAIVVSGHVLVCVGSPVLGAWRGRAAEDVVAALQRCRALEGRRSAAFVRRRAWGSGAALKELMRALEQQGAWVEDFEALTSPAHARAFGQRLRSLVQPRG